MTTRTELNIDIEYYLNKQKNLIDNHLRKLFEASKNYCDPKELWDAVRYSVLSPGKRIRGAFCLATFESIKENGTDDPDFFEDCLTVACSIELIHSMSLIHDDLPSMDNDDLRRGKPSCHKAFSEATAILAGDAMLSLAFFLITETTKKIPQYKKLKIINILSKAFSFGLVPGQIFDLSLSKKNCELKEIENISKLKTAMLIQASVICGAIIANLNDNEKILERLGNFGLKTGIAFQIIDDILDITGDTKTLGKTSGKDKEQNKPTYPLIIGIENSKKMAKDLILQAKSELNNIQIESQLLPLIADYIINRVR